MPTKLLDAVLTSPSAAEIEAALEQLLEAARDSAEFADGLAHGRSKTTSLRHLRSAVDAVERLLRLA